MLICCSNDCTSDSAATIWDSTVQSFMQSTVILSDLPVFCRGQNGDLNGILQRKPLLPLLVFNGGNFLPRTQCCVWFTVLARGRQTFKSFYLQCNDDTKDPSNCWRCQSQLHTWVGWILLNALSKSTRTILTDQCTKAATITVSMMMF